MFIVISYDITDDDKRYKVANILKDYGTRVQYSVFEFDLDSRNLEGLIKKAVKIIDDKTDSIRVYQLCQECANKTQIYGMPRGEEFGDALII